MPTNPSLATKDPTVLLKRIKQYFPDIEWEKYVFIDAGLDHEVIQLDNTYIFRFPNSPEYLALLQNEIKLLAYLQERVEASIPSYTLIAPDYSFGGYEMIQGNELSAELFASLTENQRDGAAHNIALFLSELHSLDTEELKQFDVANEPDFAGYSNVANEAKEWLEPNLSNAEYQLIKSMVEDITRVQKYPQPTRLTHGDFAPKHLIWDSNLKTIGVIDFSDRSISDPAYDFAELYTYGEAFVDKVYSLYSSPDKNGQFLSRAKAYMKAIGVHSLANAYRTDRIEKDEANRLFKIGANLTLSVE